MSANITTIDQFARPDLAPVNGERFRVSVEAPERVGETRESFEAQVAPDKNVEDQIGEVRGYILSRVRESKPRVFDQKIQEVWSVQSSLEKTLQTLPGEIRGGLIERIQYRFARASVANRLRSLEDAIITASLEGYRLNGIERSLDEIKIHIQHLESFNAKSF